MTNRELLPEGFGAPRKNDRKPRHSLWPPVFVWLFFIVFFGFRAAEKKDVASRQETSSGILGDCKHRGKGNEIFCDYTFWVGDYRYTSVAHAASETEPGQTVEVYYDSQNPNVSALEDFSQQSRKNMRFVYIFLLLLAANIVFLLWYKPPSREPSDEGAP